MKNKKVKLLFYISLIALLLTLMITAFLHDEIPKETFAHIHGFGGLIFVILLSIHLLDKNYFIFGKHAKKHS